MRFTYRMFGPDDQFIANVEEEATITRVWRNGNIVSLRTESGHLFSRVSDSPSIKKIP